ncbi:DUF2163 domain-containing protein [Altererythrobacter arenosus]
MPVFFATELEGVATYWRIFRRDGIGLGFTSHDQALFFGGVMHHAAPGMVPSAIRKTANLTSDSAEVSGALSHDAVREADLDAGLYDGAHIEIGAVDWESLESTSLYSGTVGQIERGKHGFTVELQSAKSALERDLVPRTSPVCRADFCGKGCSLSSQRFLSRKAVEAVDYEANSVSFAGLTGAEYIDGIVRFLGGPQVGVAFSVVHSEGSQLFLDRPLAPGLLGGTMAVLRQGCDHTLATCHYRFGNALNFRGEPFLPGNDLLARYPSPRQ